MAKENMTINDLAGMVQRNFNNLEGKVDNLEKRLGGRLDKVEGRLDKVEGRLMKIEIRMDGVEEEVAAIRKHQAMHTIFRDEFERLESRVKTLEHSKK